MTNLVNLLRSVEPESGLILGRREVERHSCRFGVLVGVEKERGLFADGGEEVLL